MDLETYGNKWSNTENLLTGLSILLFQILFIVIESF